MFMAYNWIMELCHKCKTENNEKSQILDTIDIILKIINAIHPPTLLPPTCH